MAGAAGRRNILRELSAVGNPDDGVNLVNSLLLTPTSPDETVIQRRGYQKKSATYNYNAPDPVFFKTPTKSPKKSILHPAFLTPTKTPVRSSPRKRLIAAPEFHLTESAFSDLAISSKRLKFEEFDSVNASSFEKSLKALSRDQLVELINEASKNSQEVQETFSKLIPHPDLSPAEKRLHTLQRNVYKSFPRNVWGSQDSSFCYVRVRTHLEIFKKECMEMCLQYVESNHWSTIFDYIYIAWKYTMGLPNWDNVAHNKIKTLCMKQLAAQYTIALKKANLDDLIISELTDRLKDFAGNTVIEACIKYSNSLKETKNQEVEQKS